MKRLIAIVLLGTLAQTAFGQEAGSVLFTRGDVTAERQPPEALAKGDALLAADTIVTGAASRAQLLMIDGAKIALRPNSRLAIIEYEYSPPATATVSGNDDTGVMELVKGGFRTITGAIGKEADDEYEVRTAVGVLGIRGTDYTAVFCNGDCNPPVPDGLYLYVNDGSISFTTPTETLVLASGEYAFIPLHTPEPQRLDEPPAILLDDNDLRFEQGTADTSKARPGDGSDDSRQPDGSAPGTGSAGGSRLTGFNPALGTRRVPATSSAQSAGFDTGEEDESSTNEAPKQPTIATDPDGTPVDITPGEQPQPTDPRTISYSGPSLPPLDLGLTGVAVNQPNEYDLDPGNNLLRFMSPVGGRTGGTPLSFEIGTATLNDAGFDSMTVMRWGRWSGGTINVTDPATGMTSPASLANQSIHWVSGPAGAAPTMPITGIANYTLIGNTDPTDDQGNVGTLGSATFVADFRSMIVNSTLDLNIAGSNWVASGQGTIGQQVGLADHLFQGFYNNVSVNGIGGGSGQFSGFFSAPGATSDPTFPGGVGLTFGLQDAQGASTVSGSAVFGNP
ncbi:MAG: FecR family protein [Woeseiaceae bacterium]|nr:FecR family protein [Woeseiaceae bacterium]